MATWSLLLAAVTLGGCARVSATFVGVRNVSDEPSREPRLVDRIYVAAPGLRSRPIPLRIPQHELWWDERASWAAAPWMRAVAEWPERAELA